METYDFFSKKTEMLEVECGYLDMAVFSRALSPILR